MENDDPTCETPLMNQDAKVLKYCTLPLLLYCVRLLVLT